MVSIAEKTSDLPECERSLDELERLLSTAGGSSFCRVVQVKDSFDPRTCIGSGKVKEIKEICAAENITLVIFDFELSPMQIRNLEADIGDVTVIDRSMLILDIFALHATSSDGKLQVELAQLKYSAPRLAGKGLELSRQGGGIGSRGPGESKLETDRRHLHRRIQALKEQIAELEKNRMMQRSKRDKSGIPKIAIVGYTNAGKSTLLNRLTNAGILAEDKLFATLDPTTRKFVLPSTREILLTDTVGFIRNLPHHFIKAFQSTLDEVKYADIIIMLMDASDSECMNQAAVTRELLEKLGASEKPVLYVFNKCDVAEKSENGFDVPAIEGAELDDVFCISAKTGKGVDKLMERLDQLIPAARY